MEVIIFGKINCGLCKGAQGRVRGLVDKMGLEKTVPVHFIDLETVDGRAEGAFNEVYDAVPVTIIRNNGEDVSRWEGVMPKSEELKPYFESAEGASAD